MSAVADVVAAIRAGAGVVDESRENEGDVIFAGATICEAPVALLVR